VLPNSRPVWGTAGTTVDGKYQLIGEYTGNILLSSDSGSTFGNTADSRDWFALAISGTGQYALGGTFSTTTLQRSTDFGATWSDTPYTAGQLRTTSINKSGQYQLYIPNNIGTNRVRLSSDFGVTFLNAGVAITQDVFDSAISDTGQYISLATSNGPIYTSSDYGATWQTRASSLSWTSITMTGDGQTQLATGPTLNVWVSTDFGATWTEKSSTSNNNQSLSISSDGSVCYKAGNTGAIYKSTDLFNTQTAITAGGIYFVEIVTSGNGQFVLASYFGGSTKGYYKSNDFGATFTDVPTAVGTTPVAINRNL
jgi:photosystem II stability/assembly factor-like uncharacterized protein